MSKEEALKMQGIVTEMRPNAIFIIKLENNIVVAHLSGNMRKNNIKVIPGDSVDIEFSPYDLTKGRIVRRN